MPSAFITATGDTSQLRLNRIGMQYPYPTQLQPKPISNKNKLEKQQKPNHARLLDDENIS